jgi:hypothetical protein
MKIKITTALLVLLTLVGTTCSIKLKQIKDIPAVSETQTITESTTVESTTAIMTTDVIKSESTSDETEVPTTITATVHSTAKAEKTTAETATQKPTTTQRATVPSTTQAPVTTTKPVTTTVPITTTQPITELVDIDINYYINYAIEYGKSIGLKYLPDATSCWDTPIGVLADNEYYVIRDVTCRLERYRYHDGDEYFCVWAERYDYRSYWLYIGYA